MTSSSAAAAEFEASSAGEQGSFKDESASKDSDDLWASAEASFQRKSLHYEPNIDKNSSYRLTENVGPSDIDYKQLLVAFICLCFVIAVGVGVGIATKNNSSSNGNTEEYYADTVAPTCERMMYEFASNSLVLTMTVAGTFSTLDLDYSATVFKKTYMGMLQNEIEEAAADYCDPYCREISDVVVTSSNVISSDSSVVTAKQATDCSMEIQLTFAVEGTYWGCEGEEFPGLFAMDGSRRQLMDTISPFLRSKTEPSTPSSSATIVRLLDDVDNIFNSTCMVCTDDDSTLELPTPTSDDLLSIMQPYVEVLPAICELVSAEIVEPEVEV
jgi:hypothetical protein